MKTLWQTLFQKLRSVLRERLDLALQIMALRHQLAILERSAKRPHFSCADRCFWILLSTVWTRWQEALEIVQADTVHRWRRQGVWHSLRGWRERTRPGRPTLAAETRALIRRMSQENVLWGAPRLHGELAMLGIKVSRTTVAKYIRRRPGSPSPMWRAFMRNHVGDLLASGAYADLAHSLNASYSKVRHALQRWLSSWTISQKQRPTRCDAVPCTLPSAAAAVLSVWAPAIVARVGVATRSPPDAQSPCHDAPAPADVPRAMGMTNVRVASSPIGYCGVHLFLHRRGNRLTKGQMKGVSRRVAA